MSQKSVKPYVKALFDLAQDAKSLDAIRADLQEILHLIKNSPEFAAFLNNSSVSIEKQTAILKEIFRQPNPLTLSFLLYMVRQNRLDRLEALCEQFEDLYLKNTGVLKVTIIAPIKLETDQLHKITAKLSETLKSKIQATFELDPTLIGGFQVRIGDLIQDFSIKTQLERFKQTVMAA